MTTEQPLNHGRVRAWLAALFRTRPTAGASDVALVAVRVALAWIFIYYGAGKLFGAFDGPGLHQTALFMSDTAHLHPGGLFAVFGGLIELGGAIALALGLGARLAGAALFVDMVIAMITVTWANGINSEKIPPGYEFNLALAALAFVVILLGAGRFSIDALVERRLVTFDASSATRGSSAEPETQSTQIPVGAELAEGARSRRMT
jgi:putative oxidoreductase